MAVFNLREPRVDVLLVGVRFGFSENAVKKGCIGFILPMMLECVDVRLDGRGHWSNMSGTAGIGHRATLRQTEAVIRTRTYVNRRWNNASDRFSNYRSS